MNHTPNPSDRFLIEGRDASGALVAIDSTDSKAKAEQIAASWRSSGLATDVKEIQAEVSP